MSVEHQPSRFDEHAGEISLVEQAVRGDRQAMDALWRRHRRWVAAVLLMHKPAKVDLEDLLQEVAMTLVAKIHTLREHANLRAWLRMVAVNAARATGRSQASKPETALVGDHHDNGRLDAYAEASSSEQGSRILRLVRGLPEAYREPLALRVMQNMRSRQIALTLGIAEATVDTRIARARRMLREALDQDESADAAQTPSEAHIRSSP